MGNCQPPKRHVVADGAVLQICDVAQSDPFASPNQTLRIYLSDGQLYSLSVRNFDSPDPATSREETAHPRRVGAGDRRCRNESTARRAGLGYGGRPQ
ncbi:hypothetical protein GCM10010171_61540 [Actinokineospora fastidiosa]|uniref:Uncharacterized protein n=1 Tax=Actinokineospora fastidiosa TaxID=1816 RepID=A0A918LJT3_9PSEU|nr:hypothetical protein GCM10010171_61540 [Actinokineospora fastidiosa]